MIINFIPLLVLMLCFPLVICIAIRNGPPPSEKTNKAIASLYMFGIIVWGSIGTIVSIAQ